MSLTTGLQLIEDAMIFAILVVDLLLLQDSREVKKATLHYWQERADYYARRYRAQANVAPQPAELDLHNQEPPLEEI